MTVALIIIFALLLIPGIILSAVPSFPGLLYMLVVAIGYGLTDHFGRMSGAEFGVLAAIAGVGMLVDTIAGMAGAAWGGAHWTSIISGTLGLILGSILIPIPVVGSIIGLFVAVLVSEWYRTRDVRKANKAAMGSFLGTLAGTAFKVMMGVVFLVAFVAVAVW